MNGPKGMPSNSIVDSGTNSLNLPPQMLKAVISKFSSAHQTLLTQSILDNKLVSAADVQTGWPTLTFILQGDAGDVSLQVAPSDYWQVNTQKVGAAVSAITKGSPGLSILGLPLMNGYFTVFDGEADGGRGLLSLLRRRFRFFV